MAFKKVDTLSDHTFNIYLLLHPSITTKNSTQGGNSEKNIGRAKGEKCGPFWPRWKMWTFLRQLLADGTNASAEGTNLF